MNPETSFKRAFRQAFGGWSSAIEPGRGSDTGASDLLLLAGNRLVPCEIKLADQIENGRVFFKNPGIRPAQVSWHFDLAQAGGFSLLVAGERRGKDWTCHLFNARDLRDWRNGLVPIASTGLDGIAQAVADCL